LPESGVQVANSLGLTDADAVWGVRYYLSSVCRSMVDGGNGAHRKFDVFGDARSLGIRLRRLDRSGIAVGSYYPDRRPRQHAIRRFRAQFLPLMCVKARPTLKGKGPRDSRRDSARQ
jgi:hypothetical protein